MPKRELPLDKNLQRKERPYYLNVDNTKSIIRVDQIEEFESINKIYNDDSIKKIIQNPNYFTTEYLTKVMEESNNKM